MTIKTKILVITVPLVALGLIGLGWMTSSLSERALNQLAEKWLNTKLLEAIQIAQENLGLLTRYELQTIPANVKKAQDATLEAMRSIQIGQSGFVLVVNASGSILASSDQSQIGVDVSMQPWFQALAKEKKGRGALVQKGVVYLTVQEYFEPWRWHVLACAPKREVYGEVDQMRTYVLGGAGLSAVVVALVLVLLIRRITAPLHMLAREAERIGGGDLETQFSITSGDEIGVLAQAFYGMAAQLSDLIRSLEERIAERERAEAALKDSEQRLACIIDFLPDATFVINRQGEVIAWNRAIESMTGIEAEDILGKGEHVYAIPFYGIPRPILADIVLDPQTEVERRYEFIERQGTVLVGEAIVSHLPGQRRYLTGTAAPLYNIGGEITGAIEIIRDITGRKQAEEELERHREQLEELVQVRTAELTVAKEQAEAANQAKSEFLTNMSHELRTPLNTILGFAQILKRRHQLASSEREAVQFIEESGKHLLTLINDILDISRIEARRLTLNPTDFELPTFFQAIADIMAMRAKEKGLAFVYHPEDSLPRAVHADEVRLRQVLINLIGNAIKFTDQGSVELRVVSEDRGGSAGKPGDLARVRFEVTDTGMGMTRDQTEKIFIPFEQVGSEQCQTEGTGLGLAISLALVRQMGGDIQVESEPGKGSTFGFELELPVVMTGTMEAPAREQVVVGYRGRRRSMLIVDNQQHNRSLLIDFLGPLGFELFEAADGREAVDQARTHLPDLILMDLRMPVMSGYEAVAKIRTIPELKDTIIVAVSASAYEQNEEQSRLAGCDDFVSKPIDMRRLLDVIKRLLEVKWVLGDTGDKRMPVEDQADRISEQPPVVPPQEDLQTLYELAMLGSMQGIQNWAAALKVRDETYAPFAERLCQLARGFRTKAILKLIKDCLGGRQS